MKKNMAFKLNPKLSDFHWLSEAIEEMPAELLNECYEDIGGWAQSFDESNLLLLPQHDIVIQLQYLFFSAWQRIPERGGREQMKLVRDWKIECLQDLVERSLTRKEIRALREGDNLSEGCGDISDCVRLKLGDEQVLKINERWEVLLPSRQKDMVNFWQNDLNLGITMGIFNSVVDENPDLVIRGDNPTFSLIQSRVYLQMLLKEHLYSLYIRDAPLAFFILGKSTPAWPFINWNVEPLLDNK